MHAVLVAIALVGAPAGASTPTSTKNQLAGQGPLDFQCDNMQVRTKPNGAVCTGNVIVRRSDMLVCCKQLVGVANDKWEWQSLICQDDVRAQRGEELMWSDKAEFLPETQDLVLTGRPIVVRGESVLEGEKVLVNIKEDSARVIKPRGRIGTQEISGKAPPLVGGSGDAVALPKVCPVGPAKR